MNKTYQLYHGYRFPPEIIGHAVWLYHQFCLSFRNVEDLLAESGIVVSYETIRSWCNKFGPAYARSIKQHRGSLGDTWYMDEVYIVTVRGERRYLWRAVDQDGDVLDILMQKRTTVSGLVPCLPVLESNSVPFYAYFHPLELFIAFILLIVRP